MTTAPRVKICCIQSVAEAELAVSAGASLLGLVGAMPSGPGPIGDDAIAEVCRWAPPGVETVLLSSETTAEGLAAHAARTRPSVLQIVDAPEAGAYEALRAADPGLKLCQVIHVEDEGAIAEAVAIAPQVDALLLDSGRPSAAVKELGGTGRAHDWSVSAQLVAAVDCPVFLAGGLKPENVAEAVQTVRPYGLDLCTGVRADDKLDADKLAAFMQAVRAA
ncbi:MAG: phosphoribosylanthranilate isomerase [Pseudomonadota bacterium]